MTHPRRDVSSNSRLRTHRERNNVGATWGFAPKETVRRREVQFFESESAGETANCPLAVCTGSGTFSGSGNVR